MLISLSSFKNIFLISDLRRKLSFTFGALAVYRLGAHVPLPGINTIILKEFMSQGASGFFKYMDLFSGGALKNVAIFALGISPYISASIMIQILTITIPSFEALAKEGDYGRRQLNQYTRYLACGLSLMHGFGLATMLERMQEGLVIAPGWSFRIMSMLILSIGSLFVMWLGEQINVHGMGNGSSVIIFAGIVVGLPTAIIKLVGGVATGQIGHFLFLFVIAFALSLVGCIVFLERGERRIFIQYAKRVVGQKVFNGGSSYIPFKLNSAGVVPIIFSSAMLTMPLMFLKMMFSRFGSVNTFSEWFDYGTPLHTVLTVGLIILFSYVYTSIIFNPVELAENIRKNGGYILGIRPGKKTAEYFEYVLNRVGLPGALYLALLAVLPRIIQGFISSPVLVDGMSLLIAVGVGLDMSSQIEATLIDQSYSGFLLSGARLRGRRVR
ncbi:preprotein translocase subunit SecY [Candidatus Babeliales bacterium]|nr:preprotein translocase subunit SecY [Candidatus Babeliales bacterium]